MLKIYHNPRCSKSRAGLKFLSDNKIPHEIVDYLNENLSPDDIKELSKKTGLKPIELVRVQEDFYKQNLKGKNFSDDEWYTILSENPKLLQRPIVINDTKAVFAQPAENIKELL